MAADLQARCWVLHAFDVARGVSLQACRDILPAREVADVRRPQWPQLFGLQQRPLMWPLAPVQVSIGGREVWFQPRAIIYDFGNVSVALQCDVPGPVAAWRDFSVAVQRADALEAVARDVVARFVDQVGHALVDPRPLDDLEVYTVFQLDRVPGANALAWLAEHRRLIAQLLRGTDDDFSDEEVEDAVGKRLTYAVDDVVVIDGDAALIVDHQYEDTLAVLDFANCEHLALRSLDDDLDQVVEDATRLMRRGGRRWRALASPWGREVARLTQLTFDASAELESVENAIKLTDDHYLARIYRLAVERFHLRPFYEGIGRKLSTLWSIQKVFIDESATRRLELLEWIIIILIAIEVVRALL
jgi:hypothetical protein